MFCVQSLKGQSKFFLCTLGLCILGCHRASYTGSTSVLLVIKRKILITNSFPAVAGDLEQTLLFWMMAVWGVAEVIGSIAFGRLETYISRSTLVVYAGNLQ